MPLKQKDLLGIEGLDRSDIEHIIATADSLKEVSTRDIKKVPALRGKTIVNLFYEPSTRTRTSFELAGKRLSADVINMSVSTSSVVKGETLLDTVMNIEAMNSDIIIIRHSMSGAPSLIAKELKSSVINAGDGAHEHPTQALLDLYTIKERLGRTDGLKVAIVGDIAHSRVARSNILCLNKMGVEVRVCGPATLIPAGIEEMGVEVYYRPEEALKDVDAIMMLRIQMERQGSGLFPGVREYSRLFGLNEARVRLAKEGAIIMHPGPINRGVEISPAVADGPYSVILDQVTNGVAVRMAVLYLLSEGRA
ncbi:MAG: aspartate carbamoyltransferase catalytic subunit [Nitrospirae bacterium]|nr:aspartate carbamoyltransferase catalytic subunit [Nitrospirota bacterium]MBI5696722.1 aspartate carbamoyltransferase catalytic subunit [Nitrospirota bacterium]